MADARVVLLKIAVMAVVMGVGWWASRREILSGELARGLGFLVVEITFPALIFVQMLRTVTPDAIRSGWWIPVFSIIAIAGAAWVGQALGGLSGVAPDGRRTFVFLIAMPNWVFLPLPIAQALYGAAGVRFVLLFNLGAQIALWTLGTALLRGGLRGGGGWKALLMNRGIAATLIGVALALAWPGAATAGLDLRVGAGFRDYAINGALDALDMIGALTIPLALLVTGAQLATVNHSARIGARTLGALVAGRLVLAPALVLAPLRLIAWGCGWRLTQVEFVTAAIILSMPAAVSCTMFVERFGGNRELSAMGIFYTTLASLITVPLAVACCQIGGFR